MSGVKVGHCYRHYRNKHLYLVVGFAYSTDLDEKVVLYRPLYQVPELASEFGDDLVFTRSYKSFAEIVDENGIQCPRFELVEDL